MKFLKLVTLIFVMTVIIIFVIPGTGKIFAESTGNTYLDLEKSIKENELELVQYQNDINEITSQLENTQAQVENKENEITSAANEIKQIKNNIKQTDEKVDLLNSEITELTLNIKKRREILNARLSSLQRNGGNIGYLEVIFESESFTDFINRMIVTSKIFDQDKAIFEEQDSDKIKLNEKYSKLNEEKNNLVNKRTEIEQKQQKLITQKKELSTLELDLSNKINEMKLKQNILQEIQQELKKNQENFIKDNKPSKENYSNSTMEVQEIGLGEKQFIWPTNGGVITSYQGPRWGSFHKGIDIAAPNDYFIRASLSGTVIFTGWYGSAGKTVKIEHDNGNRTEYAHLDSISVNLGKTVKQGEIIGIMGNTGRSTGTHLDFKVYQDDKLLNPIDVLPRR